MPHTLISKRHRTDGMCGITGFADLNGSFLKNREENTRLLQKMRGTIAHRGGDAAGEYLAQNVGLAHARLTIRGLDAASDQPMIRRRGEDGFAIVYNGEIYNTDEINRGLEQRGYRFLTGSDTETILYAYMEYGADCVRLLNGIFAFAIWDTFKVEPILRANGGEGGYWPYKNADTYCNPKSTNTDVKYSGFGCTAKIIKDGWKMNY